MDSKENYMNGTELATFFSSAHFNESAFELFELVVLEKLRKCIVFVKLWAEVFVCNILY